MISFDKEIKKKLQNLEAENRKFLDRVSKLETQYTSLEKNFSGSNAAQNSKKISEFRNKSETRLEEINQIFSKIEIQSAAVQKNFQILNQSIRKLLT